MREKIRVSKTGVTSSGRIALYTNSPEATDMDPSLVNYIQGNSLSPLYLSTADSDTEDISPDDAFVVESSESSKSSESSEEGSSSAELEESHPCLIYQLFQIQLYTMRLGIQALRISI
jgi:hypothetical protein